MCTTDVLTHSNKAFQSFYIAVYDDGRPPEFLPEHIFHGLGLYLKKKFICLYHFFFFLEIRFKNSSMKLKFLRDIAGGPYGSV